MKNTTFKRRALISSIAMLLVALVALGSATFAWFTSNPNAEAQGVKFKASASKGLVIQTETHKAADSTFWDHNDFLRYDSGTSASKTDSLVFSPVSFDLTNATASSPALGAAYKVEAANDDNYIAANSAAVTAVESADGFYYQEKIYCKLTGATDPDETATLKLASLGLTTTTATQKTGVRVVIDYNGKFIGAYGDAAYSNKYLTGTGTYSAKLSEAYSFPAASSVSNVTLGSVKQDGTDYVTVTVYLDGENGNVYSQSVSASDLLTNIDVKLVAA